METLRVMRDFTLCAWTKNYVHVRYICHYQTEAKAKSVIFRVGGWSWTTTSPPVPVTLAAADNCLAAVAEIITDPILV